MNFSWTNFWVNKRKTKDREKVVEELCQHFGIFLHDFLSLPRSNQDYLIDLYKHLRV